VPAKKRWFRALGMKDPRKLNINLLVKWWWKLEHEKKTWKKLSTLNILKGNPFV
jgi:hypothetical protein